VNCTGTQGISELEFFSLLKDRESAESCCGPIVYMRIAEPAARVMLTAADAMNMQSAVESAYIARISPNVAMFGSCMAHWIDISMISNELGRQLHRHDYLMVAQQLYESACRAAGWDWKELDNFLQNLGSGEEEEELWQE
jgi:hypothetical protein